MIGDIQTGKMQTSFIPKKPLVSSGQRDGVGVFAILNFVSIIIFVASLSVFGGAFIYRTALNSSIKSINSDLEGEKKKLEDKDSLIREIIRFDTKLKNVSYLLDNHISLRNLFGILEQKTMTNLRFNEFSYSINKNEMIDLKLGGEAETYSAIALQANEFVNSKKTGDKDFTDIIFSDFNPGLSGNVVFKATANVVPDLVYYKNLDSIKDSI